MVGPQARSMGPGLPLMLGTEQGKLKPSSQGRAEQIQLLSELHLVRSLVPSTSLFLRGTSCPGHAPFLLV